MSSSSSPCAACKLLRRKCTQGCVFAPYFPPDQPHKFSNVHRVFGASNVAKLLNDLQPAQREDAVNSLAYEADARLQDPVYGCVGYISVLQHRLQQLQRDLFLAKKELSAYIGPTALGPIFPQFHGGPISPAAAAAAAAAAHPAIPVQGMGLGLGANLQSASSSPAMMRDHYHHHQSQQEIEAAQQLAAAVAAAREQEIMLRSIEQQQEMARLIGGGGNVVGVLPPAPPAVQAPNIAGFEGSYIAQQQQQQQQNEVIKFEETHLHHHHHQRKGSDDERSGGGPPPSRSSS